MNVVWMENAPTQKVPSFVIASRTSLEVDVSFKTNVPKVHVLEKVRITDRAKDRLSVSGLNNTV